MLYYHGRLVENCRTGNIFDGLNINSWGAGTDRTDMVDNYRNPVGDPAIFAHYTQQLYVAVKLRSKFHPVGDRATADLFIVNELDLKGSHTLEARLYDPSGAVVLSQNFPVDIKGGTRFGQLLVEGLVLPVLDKPGKYTLKARLLGGETVKAEGYDDVFVADYMHGPGLKGKWAVIDTSGVINAFLKKTRGITLPEFKAANPEDFYDAIIVGPHAENRNWRSLSSRMLEMVTNGATLYVFDHAESMAQNLGRSAITYYLSADMVGSRYFVGDNRFMRGLPPSQAMNWEYQEFYHTRSMPALLIDPLGTELIVGLASPRKREIYSALTRVPYADGQIFLSTLNFLDKLPLNIPQAAAPKKLFLNLLEYGRGDSE